MNDKAIVSVAGKQGPFKNVINALKKIDLSCVKNKSVLLKPNLGRAAKPGFPGNFRNGSGFLFQHFHSLLQAKLPDILVG